MEQLRAALALTSVGLESQLMARLPVLGVAAVRLGQAFLRPGASDLDLAVAPLYRYDT
jgi:hypothetical protein